MVLPLAGESFESWGFRRMLNVWPCYWGTGGKLTFIAGDWRRATVRLKLTPRTRNYVGTIFGGSLYGAIDPVYMLLLMKALGPGFIVWDKAAHIRFRRPGKGTLEAAFLLAGEELAEIRRLTEGGEPVDRVYLVEFKDPQGKVCASIEKTLYIRRKEGGAR